MFIKALSIIAIVQVISFTCVYPFLKVSSDYDRYITNVYKRKMEEWENAKYQAWKRIFNL